MDNPGAHIEFLHQDLFDENSENGAALWHELAARRRFLYRVE
jgi:hypothetical protein